jgi:hypothetical protein
MPCTSGRANHKLLKKDCPSGCNCCVNTAYSCTPICCETDLFNNDQPDLNTIEEQLCNDLKSQLSGTDSVGPYNTTDSISVVANNVCRRTYTDYKCTVIVFIQLEDGPLIPISSITNGVCTSTEITDTFGIAGEYTLLFGRHECLLFGVTP